MLHTTRIAAIAFVLSIGALTVFAQSRKGDASPAAPKSESSKAGASQKGSAQSAASSETPKATSSQKSSTSGAASSEKQDQTQAKPTTAGVERELSPSQKREATKLRVLNLNTTAGNPGSILVKGDFKVDLPGEIKLKGLDALIEMQFSNGENRSETFSIDAERREVERVIALPVVSRPPFDCSVCQRLDEIEKSTANAISQQCKLNNCPVPPPSTSSGDKGSIKSVTAIKSVKGSTSSASTVRSAANGVVFADPKSVKITVTGRFTDGSSLGEFTRVDSRVQTKFIGTGINK